MTEVADLAYSVLNIRSDSRRECLRRSSMVHLIFTLVFLIVALTATGCGTISGALDWVSTAPLASSAPTALFDEGRPGAGSSRREVVAVDTNALAVIGAPLVTSAGEQTVVAVGEQTVGAEQQRQNASSTPGGAESPEAPGGSTPESGRDAAAGMAQVRETTIDDVSEDYDPWEPYNERMFAFNYNVDRYVLKPAANAYRHVIPEPFQVMIANGFDNIRYPARLANHVLQGRFWGAFIETSRFVINSILGFGGLFNPATDYFGIGKSRADFGETLARWGVGPGPYFVPPLLPPSTVRDFIGRLADSALNPIAWFLIDFWPEGISIGVGEMVNERAVNYELFQGVEETTIDLYTAVRDGYLRRRERQLREDVE
jgi:phospholipid-binding lipoprotein MlaA